MLNNMHSGLPFDKLLVVDEKGLTQEVVTKGFRVGQGTKMLVEVNVGNMSGTNPTLDIKVQESYDGVNWFDRVSFARITEPTRERWYHITKGGWYRFVLTPGGESPSMDVFIGIA